MISVIEDKPLIDNTGGYKLLSSNEKWFPI